MSSHSSSCHRKLETLEPVHNQHFGMDGHWRESGCLPLNLGETEWMVINRHATSPLTQRHTVHTRIAKSCPNDRLHIVLSHAVAYEKITVCNWLCWLRALNLIRTPFWFLKAFYPSSDLILSGMTCDIESSPTWSLNCWCCQFKCPRDLSDYPSLWLS